MAYSPKRLKPIHLDMVSLHLRGESNHEIALKVNYTEQQVSNILNCPEVLAILESMRSETLSTMAEVQVEAQLYAPEILRRKIDYALNGPDDRVRNNAQTEILNIAGHVPVKRMSIETKSAVMERYKDKTEDELRAMLGGEPNKTGVGPDGKLLQ